MQMYCLFFLFKIYLIIVIRWVTMGFCWFNKFVDGIFWFRFSSDFAAWFSLSISSLCFKKSKVSQFELRLRSFCFREVSPLFFVPPFAPSFPLLLLNVFPGHHFFDFFSFQNLPQFFEWNLQQPLWFSLTTLHIQKAPPHRHQFHCAIYMTRPVAEKPP